MKGSNQTKDKANIIKYSSLNLSMYYAINVNTAASAPDHQRSPLNAPNRRGGARPTRIMRLK
eukprot:4192976-Pleurochrysis_carterae.AAC.1